MNRIPQWLGGTLLAVGCLLAPPGRAAAEADTGPLANLAEFGRVSVVDKASPASRTDVSVLAYEGKASVALVEGNVLLLEWNHPRAVRSLELRFAGAAPEPAEVTLEWWRRVWPDNGVGGWMKLDDPFNGQWTKAAVSARALTNENGLAFALAPLSAAEAPGVKQAGLDYRLTYKLRVACAAPVTLTQVAVFSEARLKRARLRFEWGLKTTTPGAWRPTFEARNGRLLGVTAAGRNAAVVQVAYADAPERLSGDRGHVVCRSGETRSFAVFVDDVLREGGLLVRDVGAFVSDADKGIAFTNWPGPGPQAWREGTIAEQVARLPEQNFDRLAQDVPLKPPPYMFLGVPALRQEIALLPGGDIQLRADSLRSPGPDAELRPWTWAELTYRFGTGERPAMGLEHGRQATRSLEEGWLPVVCHQWTNDDIAWAETCVAAPLSADLASLQSQTGTETVALVAQFALRNTAATPKQAWLWLDWNHALPCRLGAEGTLLLDRPSDGTNRAGYVPVRGRFNTFGKGSLDLAVLTPAAPGSQSTAPRAAVRYVIELAAGETHVIDFVAPYVELLDKVEAGALRAMTYTNAHAAVTQFWRARLEQGMTYEAPDRYLNEFWKANLWHVLISTDIDPVTGQYQHGAATHSYPNFLNETAMVARTLELRGEHAEALRLLEPFLANQGVKGLPGNFKSRAGVLYAAHPTAPDPYTAQGYNMHHGWGMWLAAEHFYWTRDLAYARHYAAQLAKAADWVAAERRATQFKNPDGTRPVEFGLAPAGDLEDVEEYLYYYATDAYYHLGMKHVAAMLSQAAAGLPAKERAWMAATAARLAKEAEAFRQDIRASVAESVATSPVVRLRDGAYVPLAPARAYALTHLKEGWIREGLYPALHLVNGEVYDERHPFVDWMIQDLEDNIFLSRESGYGLEDPRADFFNRGGFTLQPNLLDLALVYLKRDQTPNFLRAFYNTAWVSLYPDAMCFAEWVPRLGEAGGPLYKTPDESKFIQWMRDLLVLERGDTLELGLGVPRTWMTHGQRVKIARAATWFGQLDLEITSQADAGAITAAVRLRPTVAPRAIQLRLRHPGGKPMVAARVNGHAARVNRVRQTIELPVGVGAWEVEARF